MLENHSFFTIMCTHFFYFSLFQYTQIKAVNLCTIFVYHFKHCKPFKKKWKFTILKRKFHSFKWKFHSLKWKFHNFKCKIDLSYLSNATKCHIIYSTIIKFFVKCQIMAHTIMFFFFYYVDAVKVSALCFVVFAVVRMLICNDLTIGF